MPLHVSSTCAHHREVKRALHSLWYHHTYGWQSRAPVHETATRPNPKLEDNPLSAVRDCLFNIFAATLLIGGRSSIRNLRSRHAVVTGTHLLREFSY